MYAQEEKNQALIVQLRNGGEDAFVLSEKPVVTFPNNIMLIYCDKFETTYYRSEIMRFYFEDVNSDDSRVVGIESIDKDNISFYYVDENNVRITGLKDKTAVSVASLDGKIILNQKCDASGNVTISLDNMPKGIYVISFGSRSVKIKL